MKPNSHKILILGDGARGKSTLAEKISKQLDIPWYSTDDFYYEIKFTKQRDKQESINEIVKLYAQREWIVEGTTEHLVAGGLNSADVILFLTYSNIFAQWAKLIQRHFGRDNESITGLLGLIRHLFYKRYGLGYRKGKITMSELIAPYKEKVIQLTSFKEIDDFLDNL
jgi:hypothetical protein